MSFGAPSGSGWLKGNPVSASDQASSSSFDPKRELDLGIHKRLPPGSVFVPAIVNKMLVRIDLGFEKVAVGEYIDKRIEIFR